MNASKRPQEHNLSIRHTHTHTHTHTTAATVKEPNHNTHLQQEFTDGIVEGANGLLQERHPRIDHHLLEMPDVLVAPVVGDAVDQLPAKESAQPPQEAVQQAGCADGAAAERRNDVVCEERCQRQARTAVSNISGTDTASSLSPHTNIQFF